MARSSASENSSVFVPSIADSPPRTMSHRDSLITKVRRRISRRIHTQKKPLSPSPFAAFPPSTEASPSTQTDNRAILIGYPIPSETLPPRASLLGVPAEIRLHIYTYLFSPPPSRPRNHYQAAQNEYTHTRLIAIQNDHGLTPGVEALGICRQIYHECLPMLHRSVLIVPKRHAPAWRDGRIFTRAVCETRSLPLDKTRLGRIGSEALQSLQIRELVVREWVQDLPTTFEADEWETERTVVPVPLSVDTVYLQLCICSGSNHLIPATPDFARSHAGQLAGGIFAVFLSIQQVRRVVVYYCGTRGTRHLSCQHATVFVEAMKKIFDEVIMERRWNNERDIWWTETIKSCDDKGKLDGVARYTMTFPEYDGRPEGKVEVEFYDSLSETGKTCVLA